MREKNFAEKYIHPCSHCANMVMDSAKCTMSCKIDNPCFWAEDAGYKDKFNREACDGWRVINGERKVRQ